MSARLLLFLALAVLPQEPPAVPAPPATTARVVVIGASLSAGFGAERSFAEVLEACLRGPQAPVFGLGDELFFTSPLQLGGRQASAALDLEPTLVVALDFLFWFGYGSQDEKGGAIELESERLALLERGLTLLEELECPLVLGDFPDMSAAVGKMLSPAQMPEMATLGLLSKRVREWAAARAHTYVLPLAEINASIRAGGEVHIGRHAFPKGRAILQPDELHPTLEGLAGLAQLALDVLAEAQLVAPEAYEHELAKVLAAARKKALAPASGR